MTIFFVIFIGFFYQVSIKIKIFSKSESFTSRDLQICLFKYGKWLKDWRKFQIMEFYCMDFSWYVSTDQILKFCKTWYLILSDCGHNLILTITQSNYLLIIRKVNVILTLLSFQDKNILQDYHFRWTPVILHKSGIC